MEMLTPEPERKFRRRWYQAHLNRWREAAERGDENAKWYEAIKAGASGGVEALETLRRTSDLGRFKETTQQWSVQTMKPFSGFAGQMFINQLVKSDADPEGLARLLPEVLAAPGGRGEAVEKIGEMTDFVKKIKVGSHPAPGNVPFCLSFFWGLADNSLPVAWQSSIDFLEKSTGQWLPKDPPERYSRYVELVEEVDANYERFAEMAGWWHQQEPLLMDGVMLQLLSERCWSAWSHRKERDLRYPELVANAEALLGVGRYIGNSMKGELAEYLGIELMERLDGKFKVERPNKHWKPRHPRADLWIDWRDPKKQKPGLRMWINHRGMAISINPGIGPRDTYGGTGTEKRWYEKTAEVADGLGAKGFELMNVSGSAIGRDRGLIGRGGSFVYGRWYERGQLDGLDLRSEFREVVPQLGPVLARWLDFYEGEKPKPPNGPKDYCIEIGLEKLAEELLVEVEALKEVVDLLNDKGQVILYGPPGTGKTYLAKKLAEALTLDPGTSQSDPDRLSFVQFHPSMSYEDFFEGYRPMEANSGAMIYRLTAGPLRTIAERATQDAQRHVMIIDEINRANLPKVLGELLFLLEYRKEEVLPLYRPKESFALPHNLWFIGTMNTADRSVALVDTALRRRFHFVPFFPNHGPMKGLLDRWLEANEEDAWVGEMVALVNDELTEALGGPHLQLGASHFMKRGISNKDAGKLEMVWKYTIEPFIEEQFFDDPQQIEHFRLDQVLRRYQAQLGRPEDEEVD